MKSRTKKCLYPVLAALCLSMAGCAADSQATEPSPSVSPSASPSAAPMQTSQPMPTNGVGSPSDMTDSLMDGMADAASAGVTSVADARRVIDQAEDEISRLSEVDDAQVLIVGNEAVVAIEPDDQYQGGIDDRIRQMVRERIDGVIGGVTRVVVTDDTGIYETLNAIGDRMDGAVDLEELRRELRELIDRIEA